MKEYNICVKQVVHEAFRSLIKINAEVLRDRELYGLSIFALNILPSAFY